MNFINTAMPRAAWPIWLLTGMLPVVQIATTIVYHVRELESGVLPPDGDSIGIPIFENILGTIVVTTVLLIITYLCVRNYGGQGRLFSINGKRPIRSGIITVIFAALIAFIVYLALSDLDAAMREPYPFLLEGILTLWLLLLRAAAVFQRPKATGTTPPEVTGVQ